MNDDQRESVEARSTPSSGPTIGDDGQYPGGKNGAGHWQWIIDRLPVHAIYAEPFVGSGAILRRKAPAYVSYALDLHRPVCEWLRQLHLAGLKIICGDGIEWLEEATEWLDGDAVVYLDPPYVLSTRVKRHVYARELSDVEHGRLLSAAAKVEANVLISGYPSELYALRLKDWRREDREVMTRGGKRTECLWMNFDPESDRLIRPAVGTDFRDRQRIGRKVDRWRRSIARLPARERRALVLALIEQEQHPPGGIDKTDTRPQLTGQQLLPGVNPELPYPRRIGVSP